MTHPQLILIPGLLNDAELWRDQVAALASVARSTVIDITRGESLEELVDTVLAQAEDRFAIVGFSLGGIVALEVLKQYSPAWEYPKLCVWGLAHAGFAGHLLNRSGYRIANWLRAATHSLTHLPVFSNLRIAR